MGREQCDSSVKRRDDPMAVGDPNIENVKKAGKEFDSGYDPTEWLLRELFKKYPNSTSFDEVQLKTRVLNVLYYTNVQAVNVVARHIVNLKGLDSEIATGACDAVRRIANVKLSNTKRCFYSFATKYCSWQNPTAYPIYDSTADACLWFYRKDKFAEFKRQDLGTYARFREIVIAFRKHYNLEAFDFKQLDSYLYHRGQEIIGK